MDVSVECSGSGSATLALLISLFSLVVSVLTLVWTTTRTRRKLTIQAGLLYAFEGHEELGPSIAVSVRNPRKVPIHVNGWGINARGHDGAELWIPWLLHHVPTILGEGEEKKGLHPLQTNILEINFVFVTDETGTMWKQKRLKNRHLLRREGG
jgi:hypothetical protein